MLYYETVPSLETLRHNRGIVEDYMYPNEIPNAVVGRGYLNAQQCEDILAELEFAQGYKVGGCGAVTKECPRPLSDILKPIMFFALACNEAWWNYDLDESSAAAWMQTYKANGNYHLHTDTAPGQTRKLTAVALLSEPGDYVGGDLNLHIPPAVVNVPRDRGTIVVFQPWLPHEVTKVGLGIRQTINLGFWGPPFR